MSSIYSFLQKRKMHENHHGFIMVFTAYVVSALMLILGSDVFYNIKSVAMGISLESEEGTKETPEYVVPKQQYKDNTSRVGFMDLINPYGLVEEEERETVAQNTSTSGDTVWLFGKAMDGEDFDFIMEQMSVQSAVAADSSKGNQLISLSVAEKVDNTGPVATGSTKSNSKSKAVKSEETSSSTVMTLSKDEVKMMERIVEAEASGEDMKGKILIANVIFNRIESNDFPDTVKSVIFQKVNGDYQFSPVSDERYWSVSISKQSKEAVQRALKGEDYSKGALYFIAKRRSNSTNTKWFDQRLNWLFKHGGHDFYKNK